MKGYSQSSLGSGDSPVPPSHHLLYERVWDEADYVVPPAENGAFFVTTNVVITPKQTLGHCAEDPGEVPDSVCRVDDQVTRLSSDCQALRTIRKSKTGLLSFL